MSILIEIRCERNSLNVPAKVLVGGYRIINVGIWLPNLINGKLKGGQIEFSEGRRWFVVTVESIFS